MENIVTNNNSYYNYMSQEQPATCTCIACGGCIACVIFAPLVGVVLASALGDFYISLQTGRG